MVFIQGERSLLIKKKQLTKDKTRPTTLTIPQLTFWFPFRGYMSDQSYFNIHHNLEVK